MAKAVKKAAKKPLKKPRAKAKPGDKRIGNSFWMLRSRHGRNKIFADANLLRTEAYLFFKHCDDNPWYKNEAIKSGDFAGQIIRVPTARPYTLSGLCVFLKVAESFWRNFRKQMANSNDFSAVIAEIDQIIDTQQFEGGAIGAFNANIISRKLGLVEKTENKNENLNTNLPDMRHLTDEQLEQIGEIYKKGSHAAGESL